jgi:uncharacterized repeat protein (TIGR03803 family)
MKKIYIGILLLLTFNVVDCFSQQVLYGTTAGGAAANQTIFSYDPLSSSWTKEFTFPYLSGQMRMPVAGMTMAPNGKFYGVCNQTYTDSYSGGIYEFDPETGVYTQKVQFYFATPPGSSPEAGLLLASNGKLYGTTYNGGNSNVGEIFEFDPTTGTITQTRFFYAYVGHTSVGGLIEGVNGKLYGVTTDGGEFGEGSIYEYDITVNSLTRLYGFQTSGARLALGKLLQANDGLLYGTTNVGSSTGGYDGVLFSFNLSTNIFTELVKFDGAAKGSRGTGSLIQASNGSIYGTTERGGTSDKGTLFEYNISTSTFTKHYDFDRATGEFPNGELFEFTNGKLYGMTPSGGPAGWSGNDGVMFEFDLATNTFAVVVDGNLGWPFVGTRPRRAELAMYCKSPKANQTTTTYSFCEGEEVSIHLNSTNSDSYVWKKSGVIIGQTTDSLHFASFLLADAGTYTCEMTNVCGMVTSAVFTITGNTSYNSTETNSVCSGGSYTFPDGTTQSNITSQIIYTSNLQAVNSCDSIIVTTVNVNPSYNLSENKLVCSGESYTFPDGTTQSNITSQVVYTSNLQAVNSCDSIIVTTVDVNSLATGVDVQTACTSFLWIDGNTYTSNNTTAKDTLVGAAATGCDSIVTLNLTITTVDTSVTQTGTDLSANEMIATYQWLDCNNNYAEIPGATFRTYYVLANGTYAVEVISFGCVDTSSCYTVIVTGVTENAINNRISIYPNPVKGQLNITAENEKINSIEIINVTGKVIMQENNPTKTINVSSLSKGLYFIQVQTEKGIEVKRFTKE